MHQPCSNVDAAGGKLDLDRHREEIRRLVAVAPDEPTYCEFKEELLYTTKKDKGELVKDVSSFANTDLEALGGYGYIIFGVSNDDGRVVGVGNTLGDPTSDTRKIVNGHLDRQIVFEYITCVVDDKAGGKKRVAAIVLPDSRRRPHVVSREIKEQLNNKDKFWLRQSEVWVRKAGGRDLATAEDLDAMYEGKLRRLVDDQVRPLQQRVELLERDLRERTNPSPKLGFGFAVPNSREPAQEIQPHPALGNLINVDGIQEEIESARKQADEWVKPHPLISQFAYFPTAKEYRIYAKSLEKWFIEVQDFFYVDFVFANTGGAPAEDVHVLLEMPAILKPGLELPARPRRPEKRDRATEQLLASMASSSRSSMPPRPDRIIGPRIGSEDASGRVRAVWEVPKLFHDRPLIARSKVERSTTRRGLLFSGKGLRKLQAEVDGGARLTYTVRAANVPETLRGVLVLT